MKEYNVTWSELAEETYLNILEYILENWTVKEAEDFENNVDRLIARLKLHKNLCPPSRSNRKLRRCVITPQTSIIYRFRKGTIEIVTLIDNRSDHSY